MNLFFKLLLRKIPSVQKVEGEFNRNRVDYQRLVNVESSDEFREYQELNEILNHKDYKARVAALKSNSFESTPQGIIDKEFEVLSKSKEVADVEAMKTKALFVEYKNFLVLKGVSSSAEVSKADWDANCVRYEEFENTEEFVAYRKAKDSKQYARYCALKKEVESEAFIQFKERTTDPLRWEKSLEYKQAARYDSLMKKDELKFYFKEKDAPRFKFFKEWDVTFEDRFHEKSLDVNKWAVSLPGSDYVYANELSYEEERQAYVGNENLHLEHGILTINTVLKKKLSSAWHPKQGFVQKEFEYTSGLISTRGLFAQQEGLFEAKIRSRGRFPLHHAFSLVGKNSLPTVCILKTGGTKRYVVGQVSKERGAIQAIQEVMKGLMFRSGDYFIFSLEWTSKELIWRINGFEVFRSNKNIPQEPLSIMLNSFVQEGKGYAEGAFDINWVRVFKRK